MSAPVQSGTIVYVDGPRFHVRVGPQTFPSMLRGRLKQKKTLITGLAVVGDLVDLTVSDDGSGIIEAIHPRRSKLSRPGFHGYEHIIAANIDQLVIVASAHSPQFKRNIVDRFLLIAGHGGLAPILVVNKADLEDARIIRSWLLPLEGVGMPMLMTSARTGQGIEELRDVLKGKISALAGQSGVGKSSLVNALFPEISLRTQEVSLHAKGRHTTTSSRLYPLPDGGFLADTPGIKSLGLWESTEEELSVVFPEIEALAAKCKFRNCTHRHEPRCAVKEALENGQLGASRFENYLKMHEESVHSR